MAIIKPNNNTISAITALPAAIPTGKILQVVQATKNDVFSTTSTSYVDVTGLSVDITPASSSNKVLVICNVGKSSNSSDGNSYSSCSEDNKEFKEWKENGGTVIENGGGE